MADFGPRDYFPSDRTSPGRLSTSAPPHLSHLQSAPVYTAACRKQIGIPVSPRLRAKPLGGLMNLKATCAIACCFLGSALALTTIAVAQQQQQQRNAGGGEQNFRQPTPAKDVTTTEIPAVIAGALKWKLVCQGPHIA